MDKSYSASQDNQNANNESEEEFTDIIQLANSERLAEERKVTE